MVRHGRFNMFTGMSLKTKTSMSIAFWRQHTIQFVVSSPNLNRPFTKTFSFKSKRSRFVNFIFLSRQLHNIFTGGILRHTVPLRIEEVDLIVDRAVDMIYSSRPWQYDFLVKIRYDNVPRYSYNPFSKYVFPRRNEFPSETRVTSSSVGTDESILETCRDMSSKNNEDCAICMEEGPAGSDAVYLPCNHAFHGDCIKKWLTVSHYCPLCRFKMPTQR